MSKHETPMIHWYWQKTGGTLIEEFEAVKRTATCGQRLIDAVIITRGKKIIAQAKDVSVRGRDIIVIQAKASRLDMYLMEQVLFSAKLMRKFKPRSILSVALCTRDDDVLRPLLHEYENIKVVVCPFSG